MKLYNILTAISMMGLLLCSDLESYLYTWKFQNKLGFPVDVTICTRSISNWCDTRKLNPGEETSWGSNGECLDYLRVNSEFLGEIETRPGWSKSKFDTLPTTGLGLSCRNFSLRIKHDFEDAAMLEEY